MVSSLLPSTQEFLNNVNRIGQEMTVAQTQLRQVYRVNVVSDSPDVISPLLQAQANLSSARADYYEPRPGVDRSEHGRTGARERDQPLRSGADSISGGRHQHSDRLRPRHDRPAVADHRAADGRPRQHQRERPLYFLGRCRPDSALYVRSHAGRSGERLPGIHVDPHRRSFQWNDLSGRLERTADIRFRRSDDERFHVDQYHGRRRSTATTRPLFPPRTMLSQASRRI